MNPTARARREAIREAALLLGVGRGATVDDVIAARRAQAKQWHPDVNPRSGAEQMGRINRACDLLCDHLRKGGVIDVGPAVTPGPQAPKPRPPRVFDVELTGADNQPWGLSVAVHPPDRYARLEIDAVDAQNGCTRTVRFVRREPGRCLICAGLGAPPNSPKRICPHCGGDSFMCPTCEGRGWVHLEPGSCIPCEGTGAALVENTVYLRVPPGLDRVERARVRGWGDVAADGTASDLWVDLVPTVTSVASGPWHFEYFGHNWPPAEPRSRDGVLTILNSPLPDTEMRDLGFWRDPRSGNWVRPAPADGGRALLDLIRQRQFFVPPAGAAARFDQATAG